MAGNLRGWLLINAEFVHLFTMIDNDYINLLSTLGRERSKVEKDFIKVFGCVRWRLSKVKTNAFPCVLTHNLADFPPHVNQYFRFFIARKLAGA